MRLVRAMRRMPKLSAGRRGLSPTSAFLPRVFGWMFLGLCITGAVAALIGSNDALLTDITESPGIVFGVVIGQLVLVIALIAAINRIPVGLILPMQMGVQSLAIAGDFGQHP